MLKNYLKIAWRTITNDKFFTFIKIGGFAIGIAACLLIALFIGDELSYDAHYKNKNQIYRVGNEAVVDGQTGIGAHFAAPFSKAVKEDYPEIVKSGRFLSSELFGTGDKEMRLEGTTQNIFEEGFIFADQELLEIFEVPFSNGNPENALSEPGTIVISQEKADKYYPNGDALGKILILDNDTEKPYKITGVMASTATKSHFDYDFIMTMEGRGFYKGESENWGASNYYTYILVNEGVQSADLEKKLQAIIDKYLTPAYREYQNQRLMDILATIKFKLQPIQDVHLKSDNWRDNLKHGDIRFVWLFGAIAAFVLLLACINFINISTAKSANRAKEVGLRKTIGAFRSNLVNQFITESVIFSVISFVLGTFLALGLLSTFNGIASKSLSIPWGQWWFLPVIIIAAVSVGILAGLYPAFYLSAFRPVDVLKGSLSLGGKSGKLRSGLVIFQFTTSVVLIIGTLIIYQQMDYILDKKLGYDKEQVLVLRGTTSLGNKVQAFKKQVLALPGVARVTVSDYLPIEGSKRNTNTFNLVGTQGQTSAGGQRWIVDEDYIRTMGMKILKGRDFSSEMATDSTEAVIINESMAEDLALQEPIGKQITNGGANMTIIGVVEDFHFNSLKETIGPLAMNWRNSPGMVSVKLKTENMNENLASISNIWLNQVPNQSFRYTFLDQDFTLMHEDVQRMGKIFNSFALFAIFVACLGLFALSAFMVEQRKKEISIRLVLGAPFRSIYKLLTVEFMKLILVSIAIAIPIGWYLMNRWLEDFAYRIDIGWVIFVVAGLIAMAIALLTISYQSVGAALIKPLKSLRAE